MGQLFICGFYQQQEKGISLTDPIPLEKATNFCSIFYAESPKPFNASYGF